MIKINLVFIDLTVHEIHVNTLSFALLCYKGVYLMHKLQVFIEKKYILRYIYQQILLMEKGKLMIHIF